MAVQTSSVYFSGTGADEPDRAGASRPPHVLLIGNYIPDGEESMQRYAGILARNLPALGFKVTVLSPRPYFGLLARSRPMAKFLGYLDKLVVFPAQLRRAIVLAQRNDPFDLVHICDNGNAFYADPTPRSSKRPRFLVTCHDFFAANGATGLRPEGRPRFTGRLLQKFTLRGLRHADHFLCVSNATAHDLVRLIPGVRNQATVIHNGLAENFASWTLRNADAVLRALSPGFDLAPGNYIFHIGHNHWYKNRRFILASYFELCRRVAAPPALVLAGRKLDRELSDELRSPPPNARIIDLGSIDDAQLTALYANAAFLFFPSLAEGFGWPILEAMACRCLVITTDREPMSELAGETAVLVDPHNVAAAADAMLGLLRLSDADRARLLDLGQRHARCFSTERMLADVERLYRKLLRETAPSPAVY